jgi:chromosome segregation ATPase
MITLVQQQAERMEALEQELQEAKQKAQDAGERASQLESGLARVQGELEAGRKARESAEQEARTLKMEFSVMTERAADAEKLRAQVETRF